MIVGVGLSSLQQCDMSSGRNLFVVGLSMFTGLTLPQWIADHQSTIHTGLHTSEQQ